MRMGHSITSRRCWRRGRRTVWASRATITRASCFQSVEDTKTLYERLESRGYSEKKIRENVECDIFQVVVEEAKEAYDEVWTRNNASLDDLERNVEEIAEWFEARCK